MTIISLIGLGLILSLGGVGSYWLAGRALRPIQQLAQAAGEIDAKRLDTRLNLTGPEDELTQLAATFDVMMDRLEAAFEQQGRFVADAAHELRTPLATLRASLDVVRADPNATIEDYQSMSAAVEHALTRLQGLVDDLLLLATEEHIPPDSAIAIEPILEEVMLDLKPLASEQSVSLRLTGASDLMTRGDATLLARVFQNLIENGIRYNREEGEVVVNVCAEGEWLVVTVADTGSGIPAEEQSRIFDRFYRVDPSRSRHRGGAGLGLSIARHIVELHGGQLEVESTLDIGSTFILKLPLYNTLDIMD
ncbi:ATP-binding protein [Dehalococcoidia bacterium]|nr:ATP-binding protein [Dehalococcoidia bacterium]